MEVSSFLFLSFEGESDEKVFLSGRQERGGMKGREVCLVREEDRRARLVLS